MYGNLLAEFENLLAPEAFLKDGTGFEVGTWRILALKSEEKLLDDSFVDAFPERFDTQSPEFQALYTKRYILDGMYHKIPKPILRRILLAQEQIPWNPKLKQILDSIPQLHRCLGVSVRTWRASHDNNPLAAYRAKSFNPQKYLDVIKQYENKIEAIFFSFDTPEAEALFKDVKIPRVNINLSSYSPIVQAALKAQILGNCGMILGDKLSTYIEAAWYMGGCRADITLIS